MLVLALAQTRRLRQARAEAAACRDAVRQMAVAYDHAPLGLAVLDRDLRYVRINPVLAGINGVSVARHVGHTIHEVVPEVAALAAPTFNEVLRTGVPVFGLEFAGPTAAQPSVIRTFRESVYPIRDKHGAIAGLSVAVEDITERKRLLEALHASEQRERLRASELESVMDATPAAVFIAHDPGCLTVTASAEARHLLRLAADENPSLSIPARHAFEVFAGGERLAPDRLPLQVAATTGADVRGKELEIRFDNGDVLHVLMNAVPLRGQDGRLIGAAAAFVDITAHTNAVRELHRQARYKDEFLAVLAHELRNPLAAIQSGLELLKLDASETTPRVRAREIMQRQMAHVVHLIDDLLDVARISSGKLELKMEAAGVREIVEAATEFCRDDIERAALRFEARLPAVPLTVYADRVRLTEVICNLLHNAVKYTPRGGSIVLAVAEEEDNAVFRVADTGAGIAADTLPQVFGMFAQAEDTRAQRQGGLGVGLALASRIVELHGGTIVAESDGQGKGSTFTVRLPVLPAAAAGRRERPAARAPARAPLRVLVLDDNHDAAQTLGAMLEARGHAVQLAYTGRSALEALEQADVDVAILDIGLSDISGHEVARQIRLRHPHRPILLIALSGWGSERERQQSEQAGFDLHLTKPATMEALERAIQSRRPSAQRALAS
ncbi:signal transduction histidine kinase [Pseudoduganella flava]|uniref:histidine kinase n=1 Tax=Pseudoduganella flava TaxID=871742 RepID=A0A562Q5G0_9BURK|nr:ATP-binding protein [Pseudoduganella flava]QGZ41322.1 PAS domain-containing protein [Pseudoduganella flava]TWI51266.1 signal transduction histidine kinase [Pseudoduganella flava]